MKRWRITSEERMLTAFRNQESDMVPICPDTSNMSLAKLTGRPFWDICLFGNPPMGAYIEVVKRYGFDGWMGASLGLKIYSTSDLRPVSGDYKGKFRTEILGRTLGP